MITGEYREEHFAVQRAFSFIIFKNFCSPAFKLLFAINVCDIFKAKLLLLTSEFGT